MGYGSDISNLFKNDHPRILRPPKERSNEEKIDEECERQLLIPNVPMLKIQLVSKPPWMKLARVFLKEPTKPSSQTSGHLMLIVPFQEILLFIETFLPPSVTYPIIITFVDAIDTPKNLMAIYHGIEPPPFFNLNHREVVGDIDSYLEYHQNYNALSMNHGAGTDDHNSCNDENPSKNLRSVHHSGIESDAKKINSNEKSLQNPRPEHYLAMQEANPIPPMRLPPPNVPQNPVLPPIRNLCPFPPPPHTPLFPYPPPPTQNFFRFPSPPNMNVYPIPPNGYVLNNMPPTFKVPPPPYAQVNPSWCTTPANFHGNPVNRY